VPSGTWCWQKRGVYCKGRTDPFAVAESHQIMKGSPLPGTVSGSWCFLTSSFLIAAGSANPQPHSNAKRGKIKTNKNLIPSKPAGGICESEVNVTQKTT